MKWTVEVTHVPTGDEIVVPVDAATREQAAERAGERRSEASAERTAGSAAGTHCRAIRREGRLMFGRRRV